MPFIETSAKQSLGVEEAFVTMTKEIKEKMGPSLAAKGQKSLSAGKALPSESTDISEANL